MEERIKTHTTKEDIDADAETLKSKLNEYRKKELKAAQEANKADTTETRDELKIA